MNVELLVEHAFPVQRQNYSIKDSILYALSVGCSTDPLRAEDLRYTYERDLKTLPTQACVLGHPGFWYQDPKFGIDWVRILHGGQSIEMLQPLPPEGEIRAEYRVTGVDDKGPERGAILFLEKTLFNERTGDVISRIGSTTVMRGDGGCGSFGRKPAPAAPMPEGEPGYMTALTTLPQGALLYRLNGDSNPIHADPAVAAAAGFDKPILHGLCSMGVAAKGLVDLFCYGDADRLTSMAVRFTSPVFPGETLRVEAWREEDRIPFRLRAVERDVLVLNACEAKVRDR
ncbi:MaoC/PaaZ C-terminal domain-containing protein [Sphingomonas sp.]|uniref:MaoC/PaaZ C-terminal domain-containing protein n=1 Tax=Sphingomonas sp. TaxID=28214 RepID=UPI003B00A7C7